jgi:hypothetical protein
MNTTFDAFNLSGNDSAAAAVSRSSCSGSSHSSTASIFECSNQSSTSSIAAADVAATPPSSEDWLCTSVGQLSLSESLSGQSLMEWLSESNSFCGCNGGLCIDKSFKNYRRGKECSTLSCHNPLCLNKCIQNNTFPNHTVMIDSSSEGYCIIAGEDIMVGQTIAPLYGNVVSLEAIYDLQRENSNLKIKYLPVGDKVAVEFGTECSSAAFVAKSCQPNARYRILVTPEGERVPVLSATTSIKKGDEITIDVGVTLDPKMLSFSKSKLYVDCNCKKAICKGSVAASMFCDLSTVALELIGFTTSLRLYKNYYHRLSVRCLYKNRLGLTGIQLWALYKTQSSSKLR